MVDLYRPKQYVLYRYGFEYKCYVHCYPQQRWEMTAFDNKGVELHNKVKHLTIELSWNEFYANWRKG